MSSRRAPIIIALAATLLLTLASAAPAQVVPEPPAPVAPPPEVRPLLDLLGPPGSLLTEPACASLGTLLGLGTIVIPGLPSSIEAATGLPLTALGLQPDLARTVDLLLFVRGSGCGFLPLAAERTVCAPDDALADAARPPDIPTGTGLPLDPGDFAPTPGPPAGTIVDTARALDAVGVPGAADVAAALNEAGDCELRQRFTNIEPPPIPPAGQLPDTGMPPAASPPAASVPPSAAQASPLLAPAIPARAPIATATVPTSPLTPLEANSSGPLPIALPGWLALLAALGLIALLYRSTAPRRETIA